MNRIIRFSCHLFSGAPPASARGPTRFAIRIHVEVAGNSQSVHGNKLETLAENDTDHAGFPTFPARTVRGAGRPQNPNSTPGEEMARDLGAGVPELCELRTEALQGRGRARLPGQTVSSAARGLRRGRGGRPPSRDPEITLLCSLPACDFNHCTPGSPRRGLPRPPHPSRIYAIFLHFDG